MTKEQKTVLLLPKGEWLEAMLTAFRVANLELIAQPRSYEYSFVNQSLPVLFQAIRSKEVIESIFDWDTNVRGGFTGTDIAAEERVDISQIRNWMFPLQELNPDAPQPYVYLGSTPNLRAKNQNPSVADLAGTTIYTEYPTLAQKCIDAATIDAKIKTVQGASEGRWRIDPRNGAIVSIRNTDATLKANNIELMLDIMSAGVVYIEGSNMSLVDKLRVDDLREKIFLAARKILTNT